MSTAAGDLVRTWDLATGRERFALRIPDATDEMRWSDDGSHLAIGSFGGVVRIVDRHGTAAAILRDDAPGSFRTSAVRFSPDGRISPPPPRSRTARAPAPRR